MSKAQKIISVIEAVVLISIAFVLISLPEGGYDAVIIVLGIGFIIKGVVALWNHFTLSTNMVGSRRTFYYGIMILDLGVFTICLGQVPQIYVMLYLCGLYFFSGAISILSALDQKRMGSKHYKMKLFQGLINILIGVLCIVFLRSEDMIIFIYAGGLAYNGIIRIINALRNNEVVYIQ